MPHRLVVALVLLAACGGSRAAPSPPPPVAVPTDAAPRAPEEPPAPPPPQSTVIGVAIEVTPPGAEIYLDGELYNGDAEALAAGIPLDPGVHQLEIKHTGYKPYRVEFMVSDKTETFVVELERDH